MEAVRGREGCILEDKVISALVDECRVVIDRDQTVLVELQYLQVISSELYNVYR